MKKYGINYKKTYNPPNFKSYEKYSYDLLYSLLIGFIDGDGNVYVNRKKYQFNINITSHNSWRDFLSNLLTHLKIDYNLYNRGNITLYKIGKKASVLSVYKKVKMLNIKTLKRKWEKIEL